MNTSRSHWGWLLLKCSEIGAGLNEAKTNCRIASSQDMIYNGLLYLEGKGHSPSRVSRVWHSSLA